MSRARYAYRVNDDISGITEYFSSWSKAFCRVHGGRKQTIDCSDEDAGVWGDYLNGMSIRRVEIK